MKNYLMLNNKQIELSAEQVKQIEESFGFNKTQLKDVAATTLGFVRFVSLTLQSFNLIR